MTGFVVPLAAASAVSEVGGKGASLARMAAAGLPVPPGFHITTAAYRRFVAEHRLQEQILAAASGAHPDLPDPGKVVSIRRHLRYQGLCFLVLQYGVWAL